MPMQCPSCSREMSEEHVGAVLVDVCRACPAVWFDAGELQALHAGGDRPAAQAYPTDPSRFIAAAAPALLRCRRCASGYLQAGTIGDRHVLRCDRCAGHFVALPSRSGATLEELRPWLEMAAEELFFWVLPTAASGIPR